MKFLTIELASEFRLLGVELSAAAEYMRGMAAKNGFTTKDADPDELKIGIEHEMEHSDNPDDAKKIALDHLAEHAHYYTQILIPAENKAEDRAGDIKIEAVLKKIDPAKMIGIHATDEEQVKSLTGTVTKDGFSEACPVLVVDTPLGFLTLDGHHRGEVARDLKLKTIPALVITWQAFSNLLMLRFKNVLPRKMKELDKYIYVDGKPYDLRSSNGAASGASIGSTGSTGASSTASTGSTGTSTGTASTGSQSTSSERFTCLCTCSVVDKAVEFCGKRYIPDQAKAYVIATMLTSLPVYTKTRRAWTAATIANSACSAQNQLIDREHNLKFYAALRGATKDDVVGSIVDYDFPGKKEAIELAADGKGVPFQILLVLFRKVEGVEKMVSDIPTGTWKLSQECEFDREESAFYDVDDKKFYKYAECSDEMKTILTRNTVQSWNGHQMLFCPGGEDGVVLFSGCAMTRWPLDVTAKTESLAASEEPSDRRSIAGFTNAKEKEQMQVTKLFESLVCAEAWRGDNVPDEMFGYVPPEAKGKNGKKSARKFPLGSKGRKGLDPAILRNALARFSQADLPASAKAGVKAKILSAVKRWNAAHAAQKIEFSEKSGGQEFEVSGQMCAGQTCEAALFHGEAEEKCGNHSHSIMSNGVVMPHGGHSHMLEILSIDLGEGVLNAVTTSAYDYLTQPAVPGEAMSADKPGSTQRKMYEHRHMVRLTKESVSGETDVTGALITSQSGQAACGGGKDLQMTRQEVCAGLRERAAKLKETDAEAAAFLEKHAAEMEKEASADSVESTIAARLKEGTLVTKEAHDQAISAAKQAGKDELQKEISAKEEAAKAQAEATQTRIASVVSAGLKPETVLGKDRTIQSVVSSIPVGADGDKLFTERLEEWTSMLKVAGAKKESAASAADPKLHALGSKEAEKPATKPTELTKQQRSMAIL
jgi:hypothetical protein